MAKSNDPDAKPITLFFSPDEQVEVKTECAALGFSYTEYFFYLRGLRKPPTLNLPSRKKARKGC